MRNLEKIDEFRREAGSALFTRQQAMGIATQLLQRELKESNSPEDAATLTAALQRMSMRYLDQTETETDALLDAFNVARLTADDVLKAINDVLFDVG